jgi:glycosyltransferase involved in cell wall biosynthesis
MNPRYSFIIPAYNEESLNGRTLDVLRESAAQLQGGFEIIVANDDSSDRTPEIAREKGARILDVKKRQIAAVRNAGASIATGEILVFVDTDTLVPANSLLAMEKLLQRPDIVAGGARLDFDRRRLGGAESARPFSCSFISPNASPRAGSYSHVAMPSTKLAVGMNAISRGKKSISAGLSNGSASFASCANRSLLQRANSG